MPANMELRSYQAGTNVAHLYPSELLPSLQSLLARLATFDFEHTNDIETIRNSSVDDWLKHATIQKLEERHRERRAPYIRQLTIRQRQMQALAA
jgi:hypothetical protein